MFSPSPWPPLPVLGRGQPRRASPFPAAPGPAAAPGPPAAGAAPPACPAAAWAGPGRGRGGGASRLRRLQGRRVPLAAPHGAMQLQWEGEETHPPRPAAAFVSARPSSARSGSGSAGARRREQMEPEGKAEPRSRLRGSPALLSQVLGGGCGGRGEPGGERGGAGVPAGRGGRLDPGPAPLQMCGALLPCPPLPSPPGGRCPARSRRLCWRQGPAPPAPSPGSPGFVRAAPPGAGGGPAERSSLRGPGGALS